jgi:S-adenosyl methyltransferase
MGTPGTPEGVDPTIASPARMYDYFLGGKANYPVDRKAGEQVLAKLPETRWAAWSSRGFLQRAARRMAELGVSQFIDIGSGLPTENNTHQVVQRVNPAARVVYVDQDPTVRVHAMALLADESVSGTAFVTGDLREPDKILNNSELRKLIDFNKPIAVLMVAVLHFVLDDRDPRGLIAQYVDAIPSGSYLAISHATADGKPDDSVQNVINVYANASENFKFRTKDEVRQFFTGLDLLPPYEGAEPDITDVGTWGAEDPEDADDPAGPEGGGPAWVYCGVGRKR